MKEKEIADIQKRKLREFDRELFSYTGKVAWFLPALLSFLELVFMAIPVQEMAGEDNKGMAVGFLMFSVWISYMVLLPYENMADAWSLARQRRRTYDRLRYLPINSKIYRQVRMGYLFRYIWKLTAAGLLVQCIASLLILKRLGIANIGYVIGVLFCIPLLGGYLLLSEDR